MPVPLLPLHKKRYKLDLLSSNLPSLPVIMRKACRQALLKQKHYDKQRFVKKLVINIRTFDYPT